ncbi:hypothetical protein ACO0SA_003658 [Hanseniaspora valbyensis]
MLCTESLEKVQDIINNQRQPKKRISKACIKCKNSKNKCINIEKGICERCVELNEICIYDYSHNNNTSNNNSNDDSKVLLSKEYLTLLQNKSMLCEIVLKKMFNNFDKLVDNGFITLNTEKRVQPNNFSPEEQLWTDLVNGNKQFCNQNEVNTNYNHMTALYKSNLEINPLIQMILPHELQLATKTLNSINDNHVKSIFDEKDECDLIDKNQEIVLNAPEQKKKRRRVSSKSDVSTASVQPSHSQFLPTLATIGFNSNGPTPTNSPTSANHSPSRVISRSNSNYLLNTNNKSNKSNNNGNGSCGGEGLKFQNQPSATMSEIKLPPLRFSVGTGSHGNNSRSGSNSGSAQTLVTSFKDGERSRNDLKMILNND